VFVLTLVEVKFSENELDITSIYGCAQDVSKCVMPIKALECWSLTRPIT
jgi:hypothetical protein